MQPEEAHPQQPWAVPSTGTSAPNDPTQAYPPVPGTTQPYAAPPPGASSPYPGQLASGTPAFGGTPVPPPGRRARPGWRSPKILIPLILVLVTALGAGAAVVFVKLRGVQTEAAPDGTPAPTGKAAQLPAGRTWLSGAWSGGSISVERIEGFGKWRGQPADVVTTYPAYETWDELANSEWHINTFDGFTGRLSYGLPLLPKKDGEGSLGDVADGKYDKIWTSIAETFNKHKRTDTFVRIGLEANGTWFPWGATAERAERYKAAWRHVHDVLKKTSPKLVFVFDITCGKALEGGSGRMDSLNKLYPGDDVVDVVGCDHYDSYTVKSRNESEWKNALRPAKAAGLADVADFARAHGKKLAIPEWGLQASNKDGAGDNPYFIYSMYGFFQQNKDILAFENYFNEPEEYLGSSIWGPVQHAKGSAEYRKLWSAAPATTRTGSS